MGVQLQLCGKMGHFKHKSVLITVVVVFQMFVSINSQECLSSHISEADRTSCEPIATIQNLENRDNYRNGIFTSPDQVLVNRCSGSCRSSGNNYHSCIAKTSQKKSVNIILNHLNGNPPECKTLEIDEHLECQCGCGKSQTDCKSIQQNLVHLIFYVTECSFCSTDHRDPSLKRKIYFWIHTTFLFFFYNRISILKRANVNAKYQTKLETNVIVLKMGK